MANPLYLISPMIYFFMGTWEAIDQYKNHNIIDRPCTMYLCPMHLNTMHLCAIYKLYIPIHMLCSMAGDL